MIQNGITDCKRIFKFILSQDITKLDFVLTWGKYYERMKDENDIYNYIYEIIDGMLMDALSTTNVSTFSEKSDIGDIKVESTLYYINICFEFLTFYQLKYDESFYNFSEKEKNKILENDLRYILFNYQKGNKFNLSPIKELEENAKKTDKYPFISVIIRILYPIITGNDNKILKDENDIYNKNLCNLFNKNTYINELELLFHSSKDSFFSKNRSEVCNKGLNVIIIFYHFFTCILNIGGCVRELNDNFKDLRLYLILLIISPSTINLANSAKMKKWPHDNQYKESQNIIEHIIFNIVFFLYNKLKDLKIRENEYNIKLEKEKDDESKKENIEDYKKNLEGINSLKKIYTKNLGYILKLLNKIYRGVKEDESQNKGFKSLFKSKTKIIERIKTIGAYLFINRLYEECFLVKLDKKIKKSIDSFKAYRMELNLENEEKLEISSNKENSSSKKDIDGNDDKKTKIDLKQYRSYSTKTLTINDLPELINQENSELNKINESLAEDSQIKKINEIDLNLSKDSLSKDDIKDLSHDNNNSSNKNIDEKNILDDISSIKYNQNDSKEFILSDEEYKKLENYINIFLEDKKIQKFYENNYENFTKDLYSFTSTLKSRQEKIKTTVPIHSLKCMSSSSENSRAWIPKALPPGRMICIFTPRKSLRL